MYLELEYKQLAHNFRSTFAEDKGSVPVLYALMSIETHSHNATFQSKNVSELSLSISKERNGWMKSIVRWPMAAW